MDDAEPTGSIALARRGLAALHLLNTLPDGTTGLHLDPSQRETLAGWGGWGPLAKALGYDNDPAWNDIRNQVHQITSWQARETALNTCDTAFYTPAGVVRAMWDLVTALGFTGGRVLEPGCGSGRFIAATPPGLDCEWTGVEADKASAMIAGLLNPQAKIVHGRLEKTATGYGRHDLAIGNVPFSSQGVYDPNAPKGITSLHGYFLWRALTALRPGGLAVFVTSRWTLDSEGTGEREELGKLGTFLGAIRLPGSALAPGGTRVVTDIVVFRREPGGGQHADGGRWLEPATSPDGLETTVSQYFQAMPAMVLGGMTNRHGQRYGMTLDVTLPDGQDLAAGLDERVQSLAWSAGQAGLGWKPAEQAPGPATGDDEDGVDPAADGAFTLHGDGTITQQRDGAHHQVRPDAELAALIRLRDAAKTLFAAEADDDMGNNERNRIRQATMRAYQEYTAGFGYLSASDLTTKADPDRPGETILVRSRPRKMGGFRQDPDWPTVLALETWDDETQAGRPAEVLTRHVNARPKRKDRTEDPAEALALCLDECGRVDLEVIGRVLGADPGAVPAMLGDLIWEDPETLEWVTADEYLSGNVRAKLAAAQAAHAADTIAGWDRHVAALEAAQPEDLTPDQISVQLGSPWLPPDVVRQFIIDLLRVPNWKQDWVTVRYEKYTSTWEVRADTEIRKLPDANLTWGTSRVNAVNLIEDACNNTTPVVNDMIDKKPVKNQVETALAADKIRDLQEKFAEWWGEDPARADQLCAIYNAKFNNTRVRTFDGGLLTFPGLAGWFSPYQSQVDMVWRNVCTGTTLCGHVVGAGKTWIAAATCWTLRRLGMANKPAMVVPNHLLEQTAAEFRRYFPGAKLLMVTREDLNPQRRKYFAAKCAARDWDAVIMTHQQFGALPVHPAIAEAYYQAQLDELEEAMEDPEIAESRATAKMLARKRRKLIARLDELADAPRDGGLTFGETGIDYLIVDEAHAYKNLSFTARAEGFNTEGSKRADDMLMKLGWLRERHPDGRAGMLMTGTPVSNSLAELHTLFRYCAPHLLDEQDLVSFDAFAAQYIRYRTETEVAPDGGGFRSHRRPRLFVNLPELRAMLWQFADIRTRDDLTLDGPDVTTELVVVDGAPELKEFTQTLVARADAIRAGHVKPFEDNMLKVCSEGRAAALWLPLVGLTPSAPGKLERCAAEVARTYHATKDELYPDPAGDSLFHDRPGALQVVFCDMGTPNKDGDGVYGYLRDLLVHAGIPGHRIVFIHSAATHQARAALFSRCRAGDISVIIGSTEKMGTGVNIQRRLAEIHHLDAPWRPADVLQRDGRGDRPGNDHQKLAIKRYATKGSFDAYMWQGLERKARFIAQVLTGAAHIREVEAADNPQVLSYQELKALATGQPLLKMLSEVNAEIARLRNSSSGHKRAVARMAAERNSELGRARDWGRHADVLRKVAAKAEAAGEDRAADIDRRGRLEDPDAVAATLGEVLWEARRSRGDRTEVTFAYRGCQVTIELGFRKSGPPVLTAILAASYWDRHKGYAYGLGGNVWQPKTGPALIMEQVDQAIGGAAEKAAELAEKKQKCVARAAEIAPFLDKEWDGKEQLGAALKRRAEIEREIDAQVKDSRQPAPAPA